MPSSSLKVPSMRVDLPLPAAEKIVLTLEAIRDDKIRIKSSSLDHPLVVEAGSGDEVKGRKARLRRPPRTPGGTKIL